MAERIFQDYLDTMSKAVMEQDYPTYAEGITLPFTLETATGLSVIEEDAALRQGFDVFQDLLKTQGVTDMIRLTLSAAFQGNDEIAGRYTTHLLRNGARVSEPFASRMIIRQEDGQWRCREIRNELAVRKWPIHDTRVSAAAQSPTQ